MKKPKFTQAPLEVAIGKACCFHYGNRVAIVKNYKDGDEEGQETVAEVWPTDTKQDIADGYLFAAAPEAYKFITNIIKDLQAMNYLDLTHFEKMLLIRSKAWLKKATYEPKRSSKHRKP